jgi:diadenosine tetraphosphate (Ap4A) HIT family hydrolase
VIAEFEHSVLYLGEHQYYRGYCVLVTKKHYKEMTDIQEPERSSLFQEMMRAHSAIEEAFAPKKMNMCSLGNVVPHIHWHFFPRYADDENFTSPPWLQMQYFESVKPTSAERDELIECIRKKLGPI